MLRAWLSGLETKPPDMISPIAGSWEVRNPKTSAVTSPSLGLPDAGPGRPQPGETRQRSFFLAENQTGTFFPSMMSYSENDVNGTRHRLSAPGHLFQWALETLPMLVVPLSGSIRSNSSASSSAFCDDGMPPPRHREFASGEAVAHDRGRIVGMDAGVPGTIRTTTSRASIPASLSPSSPDRTIRSARSGSTYLPTATAFTARLRRERSRRPSPMAAFVSLTGMPNGSRIGWSRVLQSRSSRVPDDADTLSDCSEKRRGRLVSAPPTGLFDHADGSAGAAGMITELPNSASIGLRLPTLREAGPPTSRINNFPDKNGRRPLASHFQLPSLQFGRWPAASKISRVAESSGSTPPSIGGLFSFVVRLDLRCPRELAVKLNFAFRFYFMAGRSVPAHEQRRFAADLFAPTQNGHREAFEECFYTEHLP